MSAAFPPNPALHADPEIEKRCPYCHPKPALPPASPAQLMDLLRQSANAQQQAVWQWQAQRAQYDHRLGAYFMTATTGDDPWPRGGGGTESM